MLKRSVLIALAVLMVAGMVAIPKKTANASTTPANAVTVTVNPDGTFDIPAVKFTVDTTLASSTQQWQLVDNAGNIVGTLNLTATNLQGTASTDTVAWCHRVGLGWEVKNPFGSVLYAWYQTTYWDCPFGFVANEYTHAGKLGGSFDFNGADISRIPLPNWAFVEIWVVWHFSFSVGPITLAKRNPHDDVFFLASGQVFGWVWSS